MPSPLFKILIFSIILAPLSCLAQFTISGRVLNQANTKPVANASVFLNNATIGAETATDGTFALYNVKPGKYDLVVSVVGFETFNKSVTVNNGNIDLKDVSILPKTTALKEVTIKIDRNREKIFNLYYQLFKNQFLGTSALAQDCKILNPEILDLGFDDQTSTLTASSADFLQIENPDLGYKVNYLLTSFTFNTVTRELHYEGPVLFTEMKGTPGQEREWLQNRRQAYEGSSMHFLRSIIKDRLEADGFRIYRLAWYVNPNRLPDTVIKAKIDENERYQHVHGPVVRQSGFVDSLMYWKKKLEEPKKFHALISFPLNREDLVTGVSQSGMFEFGCDSAKLVIDYDKSHHFTNIKQLQDLTNLNYIVNKRGNKELTLMELIVPSFLFDNNGRLTDPNSIKLSGFWGNKRVADLLPINYEDTQTTVVYADSLMRGIKSKMDAFSTDHVNEKIHIHLDRPWYGLGDTIWFKTYVVSGANHQLSALSEVVHTELINDRDSVVKRLTLQLDQGVGNGDFVLPKTYNSGIYRLRAYTNWMLNDSAYFYDQKIVIGGLPPVIGNTPINLNANPSVSAGIQKTSNNIDIQFFPEGGDLIAGLRSKVAFKAINQQGLAENVSGVITDEEGNEVASFQSQHLGMGQFPLLPLPGKKYKATLKTTDGAGLTIDLPAAKAYGFALTVNNTGDSVSVKVAANDLYYKNNPNSAFYLVAQSGGKTYYSAGNLLSAPVFTTRIEKSRFPSGIVQFTLFSKTGEPINERIIYVENKDCLKLDVSAEKQSYSPKEKVMINIKATDKSDNTVAGAFSVSVTDETKVPVDEQAEPTIFTDLLLTSELKGYVEDPNYYFISEGDKTRSDLDLLMLTQGYRKFSWKRVFAGNGPKIMYQPQTSTSLTGNIKMGNKPLINRKVRLTSIKDHFAADTVTDINGDFTFAGLNLADTTKVIISVTKVKRDDSIKIFLKEPAYPTVNKLAPSADYADSAISPTVRKAMESAYISGQKGKVIQLKEVKIEQRKKNPVFEPTYSDNIKYSSNLNGPGNANQVLLGDKLVGCIKLSDCLQGKLFGVTFTATGIPQSIRATARYLKGPRPMAVIIEGVQRGPADLDNINPEDVYSIEVLTSISYLSIYGSNAPNGALIITMKRGSDYNPAAVPVDGVVTYKVKGFYKAREFYSPKYDAAKPTQIADDRKTIYWNPNTIAGANGKTSFEYFNADGKGTYRVVVEGIDQDGNLGRQVFRYKVE